MRKTIFSSNERALHLVENYGTQFHIQTDKFTSLHYTTRPIHAPFCHTEFQVQG